MEYKPLLDEAISGLSETDHDALVWAPREGDGRRWTYAELLADVRKIAVGLATRGIAKGDKVLIHCENCPEMVLAWYACATVGAVGVTPAQQIRGPLQRRQPRRHVVDVGGLGFCPHPWSSR